MCVIMYVIKSARKKNVMKTEEIYKKIAHKSLYIGHDQVDRAQRTES